mmetsp:Transcript_52948/g.152546  ORF Transcript_52948/g.152546 Transcript_52948/m.152546 type:complete len:82 (-) Transcript_52948:6-251(-)
MNTSQHAVKAQVIKDLEILLVKFPFYRIPELLLSCDTDFDYAILEYLAPLASTRAASQPQAWRPTTPVAASRGHQRYSQEE